MPNRIIKESICTSDSIDALDWFSEVLFYRLIVNCDDFGRFDGRTAVIKSHLFPLKTDGLTLKNVEIAVNKLVSAGLVCRYEANGKPFLFLPTWDSHQQIRAQRSKYPAPDFASDIICNQMMSNDIKCSRNPIQSESNTNPNTNIGTASGENAAAVLSLTCNTGEEFPVFQAQVDEWSGLFPAVDVMQELRNMKAWCDANPTKRKTRGGMLRFIVSWLSKEQNKGGNAPSAPRSKYSTGTHAPIDMDEMRRVLDKI